MKKLSEIFNAAVKKHDEKNNEAFNRYLNDLIGKLNDLTKLRDDLKSYLFENSDKFEYDADKKTLSFRPAHRVVGEHNVLSDIAFTVFAADDGIIRYVKGSGFDCCEEIDERLEKEYQMRHPDWFYLKYGTCKKAVFKYPDDGVAIELTENCLNITEIVMKQI